MGKLIVTLAPVIIMPQNLSMKRDVAFAKLRPFEDSLRARGIRALYLFGSTARNESRESSDLDLLFEYDETSRFSLFDQAGATLELSDGLGVKVDLISRFGLRPRVRDRIERDMVRVF